VLYQLSYTRIKKSIPDIKTSKGHSFIFTSKGIRLMADTLMI
jgi:hypothetical protein